MANDLRVLIHSGLFVQRDAISGSVRAKVECMDRWAAQGRPISWKVQCFASDVTDDRVKVVTNVGQSYLERSFLDADVHIFEFGIYFDMFDAAFIVPPRSTAVGVYHNVTPLYLVKDEQSRAQVEKSFVQRSNFSACAEVACDSPFNLDELVALGLPGDMLSVLPLPPAVDVRTRRHERRANEIPTLLYVGRFVAAKGILTLIDAARRLRHGDTPPFRLLLAGSLDFSDEVARSALDEAEREGLVSTAFDVSDAQLAQLYLSADVFVMPSKHEGYCVPIIEALSAGCQIVASDGGNLPNIVSDLGQIVPVGDAVALSDALDKVVRRLTSTGDAAVHDRDRWVDRTAWLARVDSHVSKYDLAAFESGFEALLQRAAWRIGARNSWVAA
jgi:glycosyltransferase involved in cell wall biosynthesis